MGLLREIIEEGHDKELAALHTRIATLETQLAAANEAVELLADEAACSRRTFPNEVSSINMREARLSTDKNPLARASVEKAGKQ